MLLLKKRLLIFFIFSLFVFLCIEIFFSSYRKDSNSNASFQDFVNKDKIFLEGGYFDLSYYVQGIELYGSLKLGLKEDMKPKLEGKACDLFYKNNWGYYDVKVFPTTGNVVNMKRDELGLSKFDNCIGFKDNTVLYKEEQHKWNNKLIFINFVDNLLALELLRDTRYSFLINGKFDLSER